MDNENSCLNKEKEDENTSKFLVMQNDEALLRTAHHFGAEVLPVGSHFFEEKRCCFSKLSLR